TSSSLSRCRSRSRRPADARPATRTTSADPDPSMFESVDALIDEHRRVQEELSDPAVHADAARAKRVNRRYAELNRIVQAHEAWKAAGDDLEAARELAREDEMFAEEVPVLEEKLAVAQEKLRRLLIPRDPDDARDVIMEIKG